MKPSIWGIDPSLNSTAIVKLNGKHSYFAFVKSGAVSKKWKQNLDFVNFKEIEYTKKKTYSEQEITKLYEYHKLVMEISNCCSFDDQDSVFIESYSQNSKNGRIIDLVQFQTLLRIKILSMVEKMEIIAPTSHKLNVAKRVYEADQKGTYRNENGVAGGKFKKWDMLHAMLKLDYTSPLKEFIQKNFDELKLLKDIPKPIDDLIDAELLILQNQK